MPSAVSFERSWPPQGTLPSIQKRAGTDGNFIGLAAGIISLAHFGHLLLTHFSGLPPVSRRLFDFMQI